MDEGDLGPTAVVGEVGGIGVRVHFPEGYLCRPRVEVISADGGRRELSCGETHALAALLSTAGRLAESRERANTFPESRCVCPTSRSATWDCPVHGKMGQR
jgi:hypothetical protein